MCTLTRVYSVFHLHQCINTTTISRSLSPYSESTRTGSRVHFSNMEEETCEEMGIEKQRSNGGSSKQSMIWRVGKKIVVGGVMITSAPFLLPPLIVVSTVGLAFSVPFGLVFAGYACTEKVMSKLLSRPSVEDKDDEEYMKKSLEMRIGLSGGEYGAGEEEDQYEDYSVEEDSQKGVQLERSEYPNQDMVGVMDNIEQDVKEVLEEKGEEGIGGLVVEEGGGGTNKEEEGKLVGEDESAEQREVPVEDGLDGIEKVDDEEETSIGGLVAQEGIGGTDDGKESKDSIESAEQREIPAEDAKDGFEEVEDEREKRAGGLVGQEDIGGIYDGKEETLVRETAGFMGDESAERREIPIEDAFDGVEEGEESAVENAGVIQEYEGEENVDNVEEEETTMDKEVDTSVEEPTGSMGEEIKKLVGEDEGGDEETNEVDFEGEKNEVNGVASVQDEKPFEGVIEGADENGTVDKKLETVEVEEKVEDRIVDSIIDEIVEEEKPEVDTKEMIEGGGTGKAKDNMAGDDMAHVEGKEVAVIPIEEEVKVIPIKENAREIADGSGLDLFDVKTPTLEQDNFVADDNGISPATDSYSMSQSVEFSSVPRHVRLDFSSATEEQMSDGLSAESVDSVVHPVFPKSIETQPAESLPEMETATPLKEVLYTEERIWELMNAMRKIVGYEGVVQPNIAEELKALYTFTGVEPPVVLKDPLELVEANDKLRILMAIVGVK